MSEEANLFEDEDGNKAPKALRDAYAALKGKSEELEKELAKLQGASRVSDLAKTLEAKGVNPKVAGFYPKEADVSDDAVGKWLVENADIFGIDLGTDDNKNAEAAAAVQTMHTAVDTAQPVTPTEVGSVEELTELYRNLPMEQLVERGLLPKEVLTMK